MDECQYCRQGHASQQEVAECKADREWEEDMEFLGEVEMDRRYERWLENGGRYGEQISWETQEEERMASFGGWGW